jgi:hypothetical protein
MLRELRSIVRYGQPSDPAEYGANALAFYARDKAIGALVKRGLIEDDEHATDAGRAIIDNVGHNAQEHASD